MNRRKALLFLIVMLIIGLIQTMNYLGVDVSDVSEITGKSITSFSDTQTYPVIENTSQDIITLFCPRDDCAANFEFMINHSEKIDCALFDIDLDFLIAALKRKDARIVVDNDNYAESLSFARKDTSSQLSHNKFCIFDGRVVWTGSYNPTERGSYKNNNNIIIFFSETLAKNYEAEFEELWEGQFGKGDRVKTPIILLDGTLVKSYFCPEDWCADKVMKELFTAQKSIYFMTFSFTHREIAELLIKKHNEGVVVEGVMEKSQNSNYSQFEALSNAGIDVLWDTNKYNMHHKVFIIDEKIVVTGSFNPSKNADTRNDENVIIINDSRVAQAYLEEFSLVFPNKD